MKDETESLLMYSTDQQRIIHELEEQITAYQLRVDNDLLRLKAAYSLAGSE